MATESQIPTPGNPVDITLEGVDSHAVYEIWVDGTIEKTNAMGASIDAEDTIVESPDGTAKVEGIVGPNGRDSYRVTGFVRQMALARQFWPENVSNFYANGTELDNPYDIVTPEDQLAVEIPDLSCSTAEISVTPSTATVEVQADVTANIDGQRNTSTVTKDITGSVTLSPGDFGEQYTEHAFKRVSVHDNFGDTRAEQTQDVNACLPDPEPDPDEPPTDDPTDDPNGGNGDGGGIDPGLAAAGLGLLLLASEDDEEN